MKIHYNFILYLVDALELRTQVEVADYIFSGNKKTLEKITKQSGILYVGKWRTGTLSKRGKSYLEEEGVLLEDLKEGFMQVSNIYHYLTEK